MADILDAVPANAFCWNFLYFSSNFTYVCSRRSIGQGVSRSTENGLGTVKATMEFSLNHLSLPRGTKCTSARMKRAWPKVTLNRSQQCYFQITRLVEYQLYTLQNICLVCGIDVIKLFYLIYVVWLYAAVPNYEQRWVHGWISRTHTSGNKK